MCVCVSVCMCVCVCVHMQACLHASTVMPFLGTAVAVYIFLLLIFNF